MITEIEDYFSKGCGRCPRFETADCSTRFWTQALADLRRICLEAGLTETLKWGHPCYMHAGRNIAIIGAFRGDARLSFFNAALMTDPEGILERQGQNTSHADMIRITDNAGAARRADIILSYLDEAMGYAERGITPPKLVRDDPWPDELTEALDADPELAEAFHRLTPGRQRSYLFNLNGAKRPETRITRIERYRPRILAGLGLLDQ
jgi:uncharacterized protein YdeI (YjbR/CyaY-like superfamily)